MIDLTQIPQNSTIRQAPTFWVGKIPIYGSLILSPMDGLSDRPFRSLVRRLGSAMSYTEFINALDVIYGNPYLDERLSFYEFERPVVFQIFDDDPDRILSAALKLRKRNPDLIDVNLGCSARTVTNRGAGAALLRSPQKISRIISALVSNLDIPVTAKIRLGWDDQNLNYLDVARTIEDSGASLLAVHGRTKMQGYTGHADWDAIASIKQILHIPVIANGDVRSLADIQAIKKLTQCDGVMIGRGAMENPWLFAGLDRDQVSNIEVLSTMTAHLQDMVEFYGDERGVILYRKYAKRILAPLQVDHDSLTKLLTETRHENVIAQMKALIDEYAIQSDP